MSEKIKLTNIYNKIELKTFKSYDYAKHFEMMSNKENSTILILIKDHRNKVYASGIYLSLQELQELTLKDIENILKQDQNHTLSFYNISSNINKIIENNNELIANLIVMKKIQLMYLNNNIFSIPHNIGICMLYNDYFMSKYIKIYYNIDITRNTTTHILQYLYGIKWPIVVNKPIYKIDQRSLLKIYPYSTYKSYLQKIKRVWKSYNGATFNERQVKEDARGIKTLFDVNLFHSNIIKDIEIKYDYKHADKPKIAKVLNVKTDTGRTYTVDYFQNKTIGQIRIELMEKSGWPTDRIRLVWAAKELEDYRTLSDYNLSPNTTIRLKFRLR